jgi:CubicO group peptidase (beta-lactamase class C family)
VKRSFGFLHYLQNRKEDEMSFRSIFALCLLVALPSAAEDTSHVVATHQPPILTKEQAQMAVTPSLIGLLEAPPFSLNALADKIEKRIKGRCTGYQFVVSYKTAGHVERAGGAARRLPDSEPRPMTTNDRYNLASVSKTITATALMKLVGEEKATARSILSFPIVGFLPKSFKPGTNVPSITLRQLLRHESGIRCETEVTYENLRQCIATRVAPCEKLERKYNNNNFALFRLIIPNLAGTVPQTDDVGHDYAVAYMKYVQDNVFTPAGLGNTECKPTGSQESALCYQFPTPLGVGTDFGDATDINGSQGWTMSSRELAQFFSKLLYSSDILPQTVVQRMEKEELGLWPDQLTPTVWAYSHGGYYPGKQDDGTLWNPGELNSLIFGMSDGVSVALIINSQLVNTDTNPNTNLSPYGEVRAAAMEMLTKP